MVLLTHDPIDADALYRTVQAAEYGGIAVFIGIVRNHHQGRQTSFLEYTAHEAMALKQMERIASEAASRWDARVAIAHRLGRLEIGEAAVVCAAATPHRAEAFGCCSFLIDTIKEDVPIWKREAGPDGQFWIEGATAVPSEESDD